LYAPTYVTCPDNVEWVRPAKGLNPSEAAWIQGRKAVVFESFGQYLDRLGLEGFDLAHYQAAISDSGYKNVPHLAFAISGGGWASAYTGTGLIRAMDDRVPASVEQRTGGLLQSMLYHTGLSGGSFPAVSFTANDYPTVEDIVKIWQPNITIPGSANLTAVFEDLAAKYKAGFPVTFTDFFGRVWGYEFVPGLYGGVETTFSGFVDIPSFKNHTSPMPILHTAGILPTDASFYGLQLDSNNGSTVGYQR
jgi:lysophospholipase